MPIFRIENYASGGRHSVNAIWYGNVRQAIAKACLAAQLPGVTSRRQITIVFGEVWESDPEPEAENPKMAVVFIEGLNDTPERTTEVCMRLALAVGKALRPFLPDGWEVEVLPMRYRAAAEGAVRIGPDGEQVPDP